jgi:hypothetical protein
MKTNRQQEDKRNSRTRQHPWKNFIVSSTEASEQRRIASGWKRGRQKQPERSQSQARPGRDGRIEQRAVELGADELVNLLEWEFRERPIALRNARERYRKFCAGLYRQLQRGRP